MAKIVLTLLDGKVLTRDTKVIGSESGCCCCFCSETCERCILVDVEFGSFPPFIGPPIYQMLDKTAYAPDPPYCAEIRIVVSHTTAEWYNGTDQYGNLFSSYFLGTVGNYAEEVEENGNKKYKTYQKHPTTNNVTPQSNWANNSYTTLPDNNLYVAYVAPSGDYETTRKQLYLFCLKGNGTDGPFAKIGTTFKLDGVITGTGPITPKKIFNIDIDLHECGWVLVVQKSTCGTTVDADSSCSMNFARIPSDDTGCPTLGDYRTVSTFLSPTEIAAKDPPIECPDDHEDKLKDNIVCENDTQKDPGVYEIADCDSRQAAVSELYNNNNGTKFWPRTEGVGTNQGKWGGATEYGIKVRKTLRKTENKSGTVGTTLCCVPDAPESYYYFVETGLWATLANWRVNSGDEGILLGGLDPDIPTYMRSTWISGGQIPLSLPSKLDRVVIQKTVTAIPADTKVLSMDVINPTPNTKVSINGIITTTEFSLFNENTELLVGQLLGTGQIIFRNNSEVSTNGVIGHATKTNDFTLIKFKNSSINKGKIYYRFCTITGQTNVAESIKRFVNFYDTSINDDGAFVYYTPAMFFDASTNKGTICKDFGKNAGILMNTLVAGEGYPRSFFLGESKNAATGKVVGTATFSEKSLNLGEIDNSIDPYVDKSTNSVKFYGVWNTALARTNVAFSTTRNGPTGNILGYSEFYDDSVNFGDVGEDLTLYNNSSCGYEALNDGDAINIGGSLIMKDHSTLGIVITSLEPTHTLTIKIADTFTTGDSGNLSDAQITIKNCIIEVANNTDLYCHTTVTDSNILCTTNNKTMSINHTSVTMDQEDLSLKRTIEYTTVNFNNSSINGAKIHPKSSNITTFNNTSTNKSEDIAGTLIFNNTSINNVTRTTANTFISITFNGGSANLGYITTTNTNKDHITFNNSSYNDANALIRGNVIFNDTSENKGEEGVVDITISIDPSSATLYDTILVVTYPKPTTQNNPCTFSPLNPSPITISGNTISHNQAFTSYIQANSSKCRRVALLETTVNGVVSNDYAYSNPANEETEGNWHYFVDDNKRLTRYDDWYFYASYIWDIPSEVIITTTHNTTGESFNTTLNITFTPPAEVPDPETHPSTSFQVDPSNTVTGNTIAYISASTSIVNDRTADNLTVAVLVTTPMVPGGYTYSINSIHYEIDGDYLSRKQYWFLAIETSLIQDIPTSLTVTTTNTATSETFETILTITYAPPE